MNIENEYNRSSLSSSSETSELEHWHECFCTPQYGLWLRWMSSDYGRCLSVYTAVHLRLARWNPRHTHTELRQIISQRVRGGWVIHHSAGMHWSRKRQAVERPYRGALIISLTSDPAWPLTQAGQRAVENLRQDRLVHIMLMFKRFIFLVIQYKHDKYRYKKVGSASYSGCSKIKYNCFNFP